MNVLANPKIRLWSWNWLFGGLGKAWREGEPRGQELGRSCPTWEPTSIVQVSDNMRIWFSVQPTTKFISLTFFSQYIRDSEVIFLLTSTFGSWQVDSILKEGNAYISGKMRILDYKQFQFCLFHLLKDEVDSGLDRSVERKVYLIWGSATCLSYSSNLKMPDSSPP